MSRLGLLAAAAVSLTVLAGCEPKVTTTNETPGPTPGALKVLLTTPNNDDGALLFTVVGPAIDSVHASGYVGYAAAVSATSWRLIVTGNVTSGVIAEVWVRDTAQLEAYVASLDQAAARGSYEQQSLSGYSLILSSQ